MLPAWTKEAGGEGAWRDWIKKKTNACHRRAKAWAHKRQRATFPSKQEWRIAIRKAVDDSNGLARYSHFPLTLAAPGKSTDWNWPSLDHLSGPAQAEVVLETRLVNYMKTIMTEREFCDIVGHLAAVLEIPAREIPTWVCSRSFAIEEPPIAEPPLPM
jgi:hypothetical protein